MADEQGPERTRVSSRSIPSWLMVVSVAVVVVAVVGFFVTGNPDGEQPSAGAASTPSASPASEPSAPAPSKTPAPKRHADHKKSKAEPQKDKHETQQVPRAYVEIYNNTQITGLAGSTSAEVQGAGWKVVGTDNWYGGSIPDTTVYYPARLKKQAELLAEDLGVDRVRPAVEPMKFDRLTLILTGAV